MLSHCDVHAVWALGQERSCILRSCSSQPILHDLPTLHVLHPCLCCHADVPCLAGLHAWSCFMAVKFLVGVLHEHVIICMDVYVHTLHECSTYTPNVPNECTWLVCACSVIFWISPVFSAPCLHQFCFMCFSNCFMLIMTRLLLHVLYWYCFAINCIIIQSVHQFVHHSSHKSIPNNLSISFFCCPVSQSTQSRSRQSCSSQPILHDQPISHGLIILICVAMQTCNAWLG